MTQTRLNEDYGVLNVPELQTLGRQATKLLNSKHLDENEELYSWEIMSKSSQSLESSNNSNEMAYKQSIREDSQWNLLMFENE